MAMPQRDDTIEAIKRLDALLEYAVYHKSYRIAEPITVVVTPEAMTISSLPGPERSITDGMIFLTTQSTRNMNRRTAMNQSGVL